MADYRKMWEDLGMDVDTHDVLCEVLPQVLGDVYLSQENRPEKMDYLNMVVVEIHRIRPAELIEFQKNGGKVVGTFCIRVPDGVVFDCEAISTGLCSGSQFWVPDGEKYLPTATCPLIKASLGARSEKTCPLFRLVDLFVGETTCDGKKKAREIMSRDAPMYIFDLPQVKRDKDVEFFKDEVYRYINRIRELAGNKLTPESLHDAIVLINNKRRAMQRLWEFRKLDNVSVSGKDCLLISRITFYDDPTRFAQEANKLYGELDKRKEQNVSVYKRGATRLMLTGTPLSIPNRKLHHIIESSGAAVVCEETRTGSKYFELTVDESGKTTDEMADHLTDRYMKGINCTCYTPNTERVDGIIRLAKEYNVDGVIDVNLKFCNIYDTEDHIVKEELKDHNIPVLRIEIDYTDEDSEQSKTRVEASVEMIENGR